MKVYSLLVEHFRRWGVSHVFGIPGKSISPVMLECEAKGVRFVLARHEAGAGFAAGGYAMFNRTLGIAIGTSGPGGTNLLTAAGQAKAYHAPVLFITGQPSASDMGKSMGQDSSPFATDLAKMFEPVTLFSARVERADLLRSYLRHAIERATSGAKGPVHLCIPFDILMSDVEPFDVPWPAYHPHTMSPDIDKVVQLLDRARRPVLFLGKGVLCADAYEEVRTIAEHWRIPVVCTPGGKGAFPTNHPLCLGNFGLGGTERATSYFKSGVDLMVVIGTTLSDMTLAGFNEEMYPERVVHFDYHLKYVGKSIPVPTVAVLGDARLNLRTLIERAGASPTFMREAGPSGYAKRAEKPLSAVTAIRALRKALPDDAVLFGDDGSHTFYAIQHYEVREPGTFYFDDVFGAMGHAIGYAIGAKLARPDKTIVCLTGDGCALMHGNEISTAVGEGVPVLFVVFNNGRLDMVDKGMSYNTGRSVGAIYSVPLQAARYAAALGADSFCCHTEEEIGDAVRTALQARTPTVVEVIVDPCEIPPILSRLLELDQ
ncbi:thiamine pyrophosphate-binding protein [Paenibacillus sp. GYB003]|uniref:thiamine pyrophosphate-binding protein n=1 Tax=Paenibacillus sp. GYB003 TaxID=2994392 RepID=UPI002F9680D0